MLARRCEMNLITLDGKGYVSRCKARLLDGFSPPRIWTLNVLDTKGAENLASVHLSRLENRMEIIFDPKRLHDETFPLETLSNFVVKGMSCRNMDVITLLHAYHPQQCGKSMGVKSWFETYLGKDRRIARIVKVLGFVYSITRASNPQLQSIWESRYLIID
ncbi:hypothetical protein Tco_0167902 [Tanacetum coccineum]